MAVRRSCTVSVDEGRVRHRRIVPRRRVGGLAAAAAGLGAELRRAGVDLDLVMPDYGGIALDGGDVDLEVPGGSARPVRASGHPRAVVGSHLVRRAGHGAAHPYLQADGEGWPDNDRPVLPVRRAVAAFVERDPPDVLHLNDWHTGPRSPRSTDPPPTVVSIHNLAYQGVADGRG